MPRIYHSPSSIELGRACPRAWYWQYVMGWREPTITWAEIEDGAEHQSRQRSTALGVAMHAQAEAHLLGQPVPFSWESLPGQMFAEGMHHLPAPDTCDAIEVEVPIGDVPLPQQHLRFDPLHNRYWWVYKNDQTPGLIDVTDDPVHQTSALFAGVEKKPTHAREIHGIMWAGFIDYRVTGPSRAECARLGLPAPVPVMTSDHKSCKDLGRWAKSRAELEKDAAASVYAVDTCELYGLTVSPQRWVYYESNKIRRSGAVDFTIGLDQALETLAPYADLARELDKIETIEQAECNTSACDQFGGRPCHISRGGPCDPPRRTLGQRFVALRKKENEKVEKASFAEKFGKAKVKVKESVEGEAPAEASPASPDVTVTVVETTPAKTRHPRPVKAPAAKVPVLPKDSTASRVAAISASLIEAETALIEAKAKYEAARDAFESAGADFTEAQNIHGSCLDALRDLVSGTRELAVDVTVEEPGDV